MLMVYVHILRSHYYFILNVDNISLIFCLNKYITTEYQKQNYRTKIKINYLIKLFIY